MRYALNHQTSKQLAQANIFSISQWEKIVKDLVDSDSCKIEGTRKTAMKIGRTDRSTTQLSNLIPSFFPPIPLKPFIESN